MTGGAVGFASEQRLAAGRSGGVKAAGRRFGNRQRQLVKLQRGQLAGDKVFVGLDIPKAQAGRHREGIGVVEARVKKPA